MLARIDPDGAEPREIDQQRRREFGLHEHGDGTSTPYGSFTPELTAHLRVVLDALSAPRPAGSETTRPVDDDPSDTCGAERDARTAAQRRHDALLEAVQLTIRANELPDVAGTPITLVIHLDAAPTTTAIAREARGAGPVDPLEPAAAVLPTGGLVLTDHGVPLTADTATRLADQADLVTVRLNADGGILSYGRTRRLASCPQRRALAARDRGCSFPGCDRPPSWCQAHHVIAWQRGGRTDLDNLCLLCAYHHREYERRGWQLRMAGPPGGPAVPEWTAPPWLDPSQTPQRNRARHLMKINFAEVGSTPTSEAPP